MPDGSTPTPATASITSADLRVLVLALGPLAEMDAIAGLRARSRDPREMPGTGGEQRDAAAALDAAHDRGALTAGRRIWRRYRALSIYAQETAWWLAQRGGAVLRGAIVDIDSWSLDYGRLEGPVAPRGVEEVQSLRYDLARARVAAAGADIRRRGLTAETAAALDLARAQAAQHEQVLGRARAELSAWGRRRFEALWAEWRAL